MPNSPIYDLADFDAAVSYVTEHNPAFTGRREDASECLRGIIHDEKRRECASWTLSGGFAVMFYKDITSTVRAHIAVIPRFKATGQKDPAPRQTSWELIFENP